MQILVVDDEKIVSESIKKILIKQCKFQFVYIANSFNQAIDLISKHQFDMILLDIFLQNDKKTGLDLCKEIRKKYRNLPIIVITSATSLIYLEQAFNLGAYDYIVKPFNKNELAIRISRWKFFQRPPLQNQKITYQDLSYDAKINEFFYKKKKMILSKKKKNLLYLFLQNPESLLTNYFLLEKYWGDYTSFGNRNLRSTIQSLRQSLAINGIDHWILTIRGEGYMLKKNYI